MKDKIFVGENNEIYKVTGVMSPFGITRTFFAIKVSTGEKVTILATALRPIEATETELYKVLNGRA